MPSPMTADTITDEQIRELQRHIHNLVPLSKFYTVKYACEVALQKEPMPTSAHRWRYENARQICADAWNTRAKANVMNGGDGWPPDVRPERKP